MSAVVVQPNAPPNAAQLADPQVAKTWKAAQNFEAMALGAFLKPMFATIDTAADPFSGGAAEETWRPMLVDEMAKNIASNGGVGLATTVFHQMMISQEQSGGGQT